MVPDLRDGTLSPVYAHRLRIGRTQRPNTLQFAVCVRRQDRIR